MLNKNEFLEEKQLSDFLVESLIVLEPLIYINPVNEAAIKKNFLNGLIEEPLFFYKKPNVNFEKFDKLITKIPKQKGPFKKILENKIKQVELSNLLISKINTRDFFDVSKEFFGLPSSSLVKKANKLIDEVEPKPTIPMINSKKVKRVFESEFKKYKINDWKIDFAEKNITTVYSSEKKINLGRTRMFSPLDVKRLVVHEIGVHVIRSINGFNQPLSVFGSGLFPYVATEEGLAAFSEEISGYSDEQKIQEYSARVIAINNMSKRKSFRECFNEFVERGFDKDTAFRFTIRAYRGGGFTKDYLYLNGYFKVKNFYEKGGDLRDLYYGTFDLNDLDLIKKLSSEGYLNPPKIIPEHISNLY
jgi:uncharacterized protein (TIGR02421 family)